MVYGCFVEVLTLSNSIKGLNEGFGSSCRLWINIFAGICRQGWAHAAPVKWPHFITLGPDRHSEQGCCVQIQYSHAGRTVGVSSHVGIYFYLLPENIMQLHTEIIMNLGYIRQQREVLISNVSLRKDKISHVCLNYCSLKKNKVKETRPELVSFLYSFVQWTNTHTLSCVQVLTSSCEFYFRIN